MYTVSSFVMSQNPAKQFIELNKVGHFRVPFSASVLKRVQCKTFYVKMTLICMKMKLHAELIFI